MRYDFNLATRTHLDHWLLNRAGLCVLILLLALAGWNVSRMASNMGERSRLQSGISAIKSRQNPGTVPAADSRLQKDHIRFYNKVIRSKRTNWLTPLAAFESVTPEGTALSALVPGKEPDEWKLEGHARSFNVLHAFMGKLGASRNFANVLLLSHQKLSSTGPVQGVKFSITCKVVSK